MAIKGREWWTIFLNLSQMAMMWPAVQETFMEFAKQQAAANPAVGTFIVSMKQIIEDVRD